jgi:hypothetical protein
MKTIRFFLAGLVLISGTPALYAEETTPDHPLLSDELVLTLGVYYPRSNTTAALASSGGGSGLAINFEDTLDLEKRSLAANVGAFWRASENWRVDVEYFEITRDAIRTLSQEVQWGDETYTVGTTVDSTFDFSDLRISAAYSFFKRRDKELGVGLGLHVTGIKARLQATGIGAEASDVTAPLPVLNVYGMFALTDEWAVNMRADWLSLSYGDYSGDVRNLEFNALYQPYENIGFGLGVRSLVIDVDIDNTDWRGQARLAFQGPTAFVTMSF